MGQKINPIGFRLETVKNSPQWQSSWYAGVKKYAIYLLEDKKIRDFLQSKFNSAGIVSIRIERSVKKMKLILVVSRPGLVIGRGGKELETIKKEVQRLLFKASGKQGVEIQVEEFKHADLSAKLIAEKIAFQLTKRMPYRRVVLSAMEKSIASGAKGIKIILSGRINGAEIGRREKFSQGTVPLSTIRSIIDYHECPSLTRSGYIGVKVYLCLG
ncbi:MAG: 30S ribosomal protein S3 [Candidatus Shapirobacteria bacterium]|nr:30S ribosomal protein S3 [Candidatus Shapirobacteria bacterium]MDD4410703.1 30S ribosomal protein S3 [Candidatus Shapirobacteria bacterium]